MYCNWKYDSFDFWISLKTPRSWGLSFTVVLLQISISTVTLYRICQSELRTRLLHVFTWDPSYIESWRGGDVPRGILTAAVLWITPIDNQFHHVPDQCGFQRVPPVVADFIRISGHHSEEVHIENREFNLKISHFSFQ